MRYAQEMPIKERDFKDGQSIINGIQQGKANRRDLIALLMYIREDLPDDMVRDVAHCVAHSTRDRGYAYSHIMRVTVSFMEMMIFGKGEELFLEPVFPIGDLVRNLAADLDAIGFDVTPRELETNTELIEILLQDILADTTVALDADYVRCHFETLSINGATDLRFVVRFRNRPNFKNQRFKLLATLECSFPVFKFGLESICDTPNIVFRPTSYRQD